MASTISRLVTALLRLINKKAFLNRQFDTGRFNTFSTPYPPPKIFKYCQVEQFVVNDRNVFRLKPHGESSGRHILYLHGGAYVQTFARPHWTFLAELVKATGCTITAPDYPLAPRHTYEAAYAMVMSVYKQLAADNTNKELLLMGDSAGGGFALALAQLIRDENEKPPGQIILLSPWLDITLVNPEIKEIDPSDPFLGIEGLLKAGKAYAGTMRPDSFLLSPIYGSLKGLGKISVFAGSNDILVADARKLKKTADAENILINYYEYANMFHAWMFLNFPESTHARQRIFQLVKYG